jgi:GT2 family glycosyltransferase
MLSGDVSNIEEGSKRMRIAILANENTPFLAEAYLRLEAGGHLPTVALPELSADFKTLIERFDVVTIDGIRGFDFDKYLDLRGGEPCGPLEKSLKTHARAFGENGRPGATAELRIQNVMLPDCEWKEKHSNLLYRGQKIEYRPDGGYWTMQPGYAEFFTYFNSLSVRKWDRYGNATGYRLHLRLSGKCKIGFFGHWLASKIEKSPSIEEQSDGIRALDIGDVEKRKFIHRTIRGAKIEKEMFPKTEIEASDGVRDVVLPVMYENSTVLGFSVEAATECAIHGGHWTAECDESLLNEVNISVCTTTFKKEDYIVPNVKSIKKEIFDCVETGETDGLSRHFCVHVIDNGRTLDPADIAGDRIFLHPNPNTGGAGGFTRGMLETLKLKETGGFAATHVLFMDDDVKVLPESLKRTHALLSLMKPEFRRHFVGGAMLKTERMNMQVEDVGFISGSTNMWMPQKLPLDLSVWDNVLFNEENYDQENRYAAWWYCVVPIEFIRPDNLSLPLFFRTDDIEFSLRNKAETITMNGICLWHMSGESKYNPVNDKYLAYRNLLFVRATSGVAAHADFWGELQNEYFREIRRFNYGNAELLLDGVEDYLKGPEHFATADWEARVGALGAKKEKYRPLSDFPGHKVDIDRLFEYEPLDVHDMNLFLACDNGHKLPESALFDSVGTIPYDHMENPGRQFLRKYLLAVNPHDKTAVLRKIDVKRYGALTERYLRLKKRMESEHTEERYARHAATFRSRAFWEKYLGLTD